MSSSYQGRKGYAGPDATHSVDGGTCIDASRAKRGTIVICHAQMLNRAAGYRFLKLALREWRKPHVEAYPTRVRQVAPLLPHLAQRAERRSMSLVAASPQRMMSGARATGARHVAFKQFTHIKESDDVGRSLAADRRTKAKTIAKPGQGDKGDGRTTKRSSKLAERLKIAE